MTSIYSYICLRILLIGGLTGLFTGCFGKRLDPERVAPANPVALQNDSLVPPTGDVVPEDGEDSGAGSSGSSQGELFAEPIAPTLSRRFPHLASFEGHILLATRTLQVVIAGVPAQASPLPWQPAILAFFERVDDQSWRAIKVVEAIEFQRRDRKGRGFYAVGLDLGVDRHAGTAAVTMIYASDEAKAEKHVVTYRLANQVAAETQLRVEFDPEAPKVSKAMKAKVPKDVGSNWWLRLRGANARSLPQRSDVDAAHYLLRYQRDEVFGLLAYDDFTRLEGADELILKLEGDTGFELMLGQAAVAQMPRRLAAFVNCPALESLDSVKGINLSRIQAFDACLQVQLLGEVRLKSTSSGSTGVLSSMPIFVFDKAGQPVAYLTLPTSHRENERRLFLPRDMTYAVADTPAGRLWKELPPFVLSAQKQATPLILQIPPRRAGTIKIKNLESNNAVSRPTLMVIRDADGRSAAGSLIRVGAGAAAMGDGVYRVEKWPVTVALIAGTYEIFGFDPPAAQRCRQLVNVRPGRLLNVTCATTPPSSAAITPDNAVAAMPPPALNVIDRVELGETKASLTQQLLPSTEITVIRQLTVEDPRTTLALRWLGITTEQQTQWRTLKNKPLTRGETLLGRFAGFARAQSKNGAGTGAGAGVGAGAEETPILELACPPPSYDLQDYIEVARYLRPTALQLFDCEALGNGELMAHLLARIQSFSQEALALTSKVVWNGLPRGLAPGFLVALPWMQGMQGMQGTSGMPEVSPLSAASQSKGALRSGRVGVSAGATLDLLRLTPKAPGAQKTGKDSLPSGNMKVDLEVLTKVRAGNIASRLVLVTETGWRYEIALAGPTGAGVERVMTGDKTASLRLLTSVAIPADAEWLRCEVRGRLAWSPRDLRLEDVVLATTSFMRIGELLAR